MTISLKHTFASAKIDSADPTLVQPSNWNEEHVLTAAAGKVLGRDTSGNGVVQELPISVTPGGDVTIPNNFAVTGTLGVTGATTLTTALGVTSGGTGLATLPANNVLIGNGASAVASVAPGTSGNLLTSNGTSWVSSPSTSGVAFPQNIQSADYTLVLSDAGKQIFHPASDTATRTYTIPANASVAFSIGTVVIFTVENGGRSVAVSITSDTLVFGAGTTGTIAVPPNNTLMAIKVTATKWMANYLYQTGAASTLEAVAVAGISTPFIIAYPWSSSGFGTSFANPTTLPSGAGLGVAFSPQGNAIAIAGGFDAYSWSGFGFGTKFANAASIPGTGNSAAFNPAGTAIAIAHTNTPFISAYPWSSSGFGTKFTNPATLPPDTGRCVAFNPAGTAIAVGHDTSPFITVYEWSGSGFGTKFGNPGTLPAGSCGGVAFSPAGTAIAVANQNSPRVTAYPWSGSGFGAKYTNPATLPTGDGYGVAFSPAGDAIAVAHTTTPFITAYPWSGSAFGTKYTNPATLPTGTGYSVAFNAAGNTIAVAHGTTPFVSAYPWSGSGFGTKYTNPATLLTGSEGRSVSFNLNP